MSESVLTDDMRKQIIEQTLFQDSKRKNKQGASSATTGSANITENRYDFCPYCGGDLRDVSERNVAKTTKQGSKRSPGQSLLSMLESTLEHRNRVLSEGNKAEESELSEIRGRFTKDVRTDIIGGVIG